MTKRKAKEKRTDGISALHRKDNRTLWLIALPGIVMLFLFNYLPMYGLVIVFKDYIPRVGIWESEWCGWENFKFFFTSADAVRTIRNTLGYSLMFIIVDVFFGLAVGIALYNLKNKLGLRVYNTIMILPRFLSMVLVAFIAYGLLAYYGVVNSVIVTFGGERIDFYADAKYWPVILTIVHIWATVGMNSIMYLSSLSSLDTNLIEAATIDGANRWQVIRNVYVPHLYPLISVLLILAVGGIFGGDFGLFYQVPMDSGILYDTTDIIPTYVFRGLQNTNFSVSAAIGLFQSVMGCIMVVITNLIVKKISPENSLF